MTTIQTVVLITHTIIALLIIILVLLQRGKGADAGAAFGAGASGTVFGARGSSNFFSRATAVMAAAFFASSLALAYMSSQNSGAPDSLLENAAPVELAPESTTGSPTQSTMESPTDDVPGAAIDSMPELDELAPPPAEQGMEDEMPALETPPEDDRPQGGQ